MNSERLGEIMGYILMLFVSSGILYLVLKFLGKLPANWNYLYILAMVFLITLIGITIKRVLK